jgi:hypothetical protein
MRGFASPELVGDLRRYFLSASLLLSINPVSLQHHMRMRSREGDSGKIGLLARLNLKTELVFLDLLLAEEHIGGEKQIEACIGRQLYVVYLAGEVFGLASRAL